MTNYQGTARRSARAVLVGAVLSVLALCALAPAASAQSQPAVNLGFTTFLDGGVPAGPGFYFQEYVQYYNADDFRDFHGDKVPLIDNLDVWVSLNQFIYQSDQPILFGGKWGIDFILPLVSIDVTKGKIPVLSDNNEGVGDLLIGPYIQWDPIMGKNGPILVHRIELQNLLPTGKYDENRVLNPGSNFYSFNPYWAGTVFPLPHWTASWRLHYIWNGKNNNPNTALFPGADDTQAGQAIHLNFASAVEILPNRFRIGVNGYYLKQFTDSKIDGSDVEDSEEQVLGIGPGAVWHFSQEDHVFFNAYIETQAENRPEGLRFVLRWTHHFS